MQNQNVLIEITAGGKTLTQTYCSHAMNVQVLDSYGQVKVSDGVGGRPLPQVYVKVYAREHDGEVRFFKDGYTDLRGRFDYTSLSTNQLDTVERFALLVVSEQHGTLVREADPPKR